MLSLHRYISPLVILQRVYQRKTGRVSGQFRKLHSETVFDQNTKVKPDETPRIELPP